MASLIIFFILIFYLSVSAGCLNVSPESWNFQRLEEGRCIVKFITLTNTSSNTLTIFKVKSNCRCIEVKPKISELIKLAPFGTRSITLIFDSKGRGGIIRKFVYIHTNCKKIPILRFPIYGEVIKKTKR